VSVSVGVGAGVSVGGRVSVSVGGRVSVGVGGRVGVGVAGGSETLPYFFVGLGGVSRTWPSARRRVRRAA
jgi:hypothetical protein